MDAEAENGRLPQNLDFSSRYTHRTVLQVGAGITSLQPTRAASGATTAAPIRTDVQMQAVLDQFLAMHSLPIPTISPDQARQQPTIGDAMRAVLGS